MDFRIVISLGCFGPGIGLVLTKVMEEAKEIRSGDKKRGAAPAGCRAALWSAGGCWPFWGPERQGGRARRRGRWCCRWRPGRRCDGLPVVACLAAAGGLPGMDGAGNGPAAICGGNSAVFNQPLIIFLVVAMVWWLAVFFLCSYRQFRRCWRLFRSPGAGRWWSVSGVVWGGWLLDQ